MNLERLKTIWGLSREGAEHYRTTPIKIFARLAYLSKKFRVNAEEACRVGIVDPNLSDEEVARRFISKYLLIKIQTQYNPETYFGLTEDKAVFAGLCQGHAIPHPNLIAAIGPHGGWTGNGANLRDRKAWETFFAEELPDRFVIKPAGGWRGMGVRVLSRKGALFEDNEGALRNAAQLYEFLEPEKPGSRWLFQEVLANHPELVRLTGSEGISTCRMNTWVDSSGKSRLFHAHFRAIVGDNVVDNISYGRTGNVVCGVDLENGALIESKKAASQWGCEEVDAHPDTGIAFKGFKMPDWGEACALVVSIAPKFLPARLLGWDVAFTPGGPVIVECNACWDPVNSLDCSPRVIDPIREDYRKLLR